MTVEQIESRVHELQIEARKIEQRLRHLEGSHEYVKEHNENLSFTGDSWKETVRRQNGSPKEIEDTRKELDKVFSEIKRLNEAKNFAKTDKEVEAEEKLYREKVLGQKEQKIIEEKKFEELRNKRESKLQKKRFEEIKKTYKKFSRNKDLIDKITNSRPKWKKLKNYSVEELDFLLKLSKGETKYQEYKNSKGTLEEQKKRYESDFRSAYNNKNSLERMMELNEKLEKTYGGRHI